MAINGGVDMTQIPLVDLSDQAAKAVSDLIMEYIKLKGQTVV